MVTALAIMLVACQSREVARQDSPTATDSAGVQIILNREPAWERGRGWKIADIPTVDLGSNDTGVQQFHRVGGAVMLSDGRIVIAHQSTEQLRVFDASGEYLETWGRVGDGPGEYRELETVYRAGMDSLLVYEFSGALTVLDSKGGFVSRVRLPIIWRHLPDDPRFGELRGQAVGGARPLLLGRLSNGRYLGRSDVGRMTVSGEVIPPGFSTVEEPVLIYQADGSVLDTLGMLMTGEFQGGLPTDDLGLRKLSVPFGRTPGFAFFGDLLYFGDGGSYEVRVLSVDGSVRRLIRKEHLPKAVRPEDEERYRAGYRAKRLAEVNASRSERRQSGEGLSDDVIMSDVERTLGATKFPGTFPAFDELRVDALGNLWVRSYRAPWDSAAAPVWSVFDSTGRWLGDLSMPSRFEVFEIGANSVLGLWRDEDDVEYVRVYPISK